MNRYMINVNFYIIRLKYIYSFFVYTKIAFLRGGGEPLKKKLKNNISIFHSLSCKNTKDIVLYL